ncbi:endoglucanase [Tranquillimonas rosea]|uniref:cellulase n=1 Tax=Tranquillimonas rosea TaxID=641238 RepID=A0A1H9WKG2_9RHOB|nr:glycosyl hydrolase family 8 [Tranquillimonas rosea]SES34422.1 endoglucanase [Tranquillimonas rosea]
MTTRRSVLGLIAGLPLIAAGSRLAAQSSDPMTPLWQAWKDVHMTAEGRVVDAFQEDASHSESQGYGLLLAEAFGDREGFEQLLDWSLSNLAVRPDDALLSWRWQPAEGGRVTDSNNATDGDIFHAWALVRAAERFGEARYTELATAIANDIERLCIRPCPDDPDCTLLLPGVEGFEYEDGFIVNPAYTCPRAMTQIARATGVSALETVSADSVAMLARLTRESLPPDWVAVTSSGFAEPPEKSFDFGYEALRLPLYLVWSGLAGHPAVLYAAEAWQPFVNAETPQTPTIIDRTSGEIMETSPDTGYRAIAVLAACSRGDVSPGAMPAFTANQPYYPATLHLLALVAQREAQFSCYSL